MMKKLFLLLLPLSLWSQEPVFNEMIDTVRFIRLAETKKQLKFEENKLLKLNEILDQYEEKKFSLVHRENQTKRIIASGNYKDGSEKELLKEYRDLRESFFKNELTLIDEVQELLTPKESMEFFVFYERFQRDIFQRARRLQDRKQNMPTQRKRMNRN